MCHFNHFPAKSLDWPAEKNQRNADILSTTFTKLPSTLIRKRTKSNSLSKRQNHKPSEQNERIQESENTHVRPEERCGESAEATRQRGCDGLRSKTKDKRTAISFVDTWRMPRQFRPPIGILRPARHPAPETATPHWRIAFAFAAIHTSAP